MAGKKTSDTTRGDLGAVVVIGGNGFLGHHIVNQALDSWTTKSVTSVDLRCERNRRAEAAYHECDITDADALRDLLVSLKPDVVVHTASPVASHKSAHALFRKVNVEGTAAVIAASRAAGVKALVYTSSASVISDNRTDLLNADERWPLIRGAQQHEYYSETKAAAEELVLAANRQDSDRLLTAAVRPAGIFGEGDVQLLAGLLKAYRDGNNRVQIGDNTNIFDFTYVGNVAHAHLLAARLLLASAAAKTVPLDHERVDGEAFFVTNDSPVYFWDFARAVWRVAGSQDGPGASWTMSRGTGLVLGSLAEAFSTITGRPGTFNQQSVTFSTMSRYYNITKAKRVLGYEPLWTLQEGVDRGVRWFLDQEKKGTAKAQ